MPLLARAPFAALLFAALLLGGAGCAGVSGRAAGRATRGAFDELDKPETKERIAALLADPRIGAATRGLTAEVTGAFLDELTTEEREVRIAEALDRFAARVGGPLADAVVAASPELTDAVLRTASSRQGRARLSAVGAALTDGVSVALARGLRRDLGPAAREVIAVDVADGLAQALESARLQRAIGRTARVFGREAMIGADEGLREARLEEGTVLGAFGETAERGGRLFRALSLALGLGALLFLALFVWAWRRQRRARRAQQASEAALLLLASVVEVAQDRPWGRELIRLLQEQVGDKPGAAHLRELLDAHPELRVHVPRRGETPDGGEPVPHPT